MMMKLIDPIRRMMIKGFLFMKEMMKEIVKIVGLEKLKKTGGNT